MSLELIKTTMADTYYEMGYISAGEWIEEYEVLCDVFYDWKARFGEREGLVFEFECEDVLDKMIVSYITGKTRKIQRWFRSFEELPMACPYKKQNGAFLWLWGDIGLIVMSARKSNN